MPTLLMCSITCICFESVKLNNINKNTKLKPFCNKRYLFYTSAPTDSKFYYYVNGNYGNFFKVASG